MDYDLLRRNQRSKRACLKQILLMILLLLTVSAWLLYQIHQSGDNRTERFGGEIKIFEEFGIVLLGRKVMIPSSWLNNQIPLVVEAENEIKDSFKENSGKILIHEKYPNNDVQVNDEKDETDGIYRFHDENGVPPEVNEAEHYYGNSSGFSFRKEREVNSSEAVTSSGDDNDVQVDFGSKTRADTSGISDGLTFSFVR